MRKLVIALLVAAGLAATASIARAECNPSCLLDFGGECLGCVMQ